MGINKNELFSNYLTISQQTQATVSFSISYRKCLTFFTNHTFFNTQEGLRTFEKQYFSILILLQI